MSVPRLRTLDELARLVADDPRLHVRYSRGPEHDAHEQSVDGESGLRLPGLSVNPLAPEAWWSRPLHDWLARQVCQYRHLAEKSPDRYAWILRGTMIGRGPDCEPLLADVVPVAVLDEQLLTEADERYRRAFRRGAEPADSEA